MEAHGRVYRFVSNDSLLLLSKYESMQARCWRFLSCHVELLSNAAVLLRAMEERKLGSESALSDRRGLLRLERTTEVQCASRALSE